MALKAFMSAGIPCASGLVPGGNRIIPAVKNELNALWLKTTEAQELMFYGKGAGPLPTGSAIMGDVIAIATALAKNAAYDIVVPGGVK